MLLVENHCPIGVAAHTCSNLCNSELQLFHRLLGKSYRIERTAHAISGSRHCAYLIRPRER
jgi:predicted ArsR family transcriptional regulator